MTREFATDQVSPTAVASRSTAVAPRLREYLPATPLVTFGAFGDELGVEMLVKCEHQQRTGSFKARGALAKSLTLSVDQLRRGVVTASTGNHGLGVANAMATLGGHCLVFVPENASETKVAALRRFGAEIHAEGTDSGVLETVARAHAAEHGLTYLSPYNDVDVVAGKGTTAVEILEQLDGRGVDRRGVDAVFVAVGGGGLISGVAAVLKERLPGVRVVGASPSLDAAMAASIQAGRVVTVDARPSLSDGTAGSIEEGALTLALCQTLVDDWLLIDEPEIQAALRTVIDTEHALVEGAAAVAFAAARRLRDEIKGQRIAVVSCGGNISATTLAQALTATP
jgi:threonine dehydratase